MVKRKTSSFLLTPCIVMGPNIYYRGWDWPALDPFFWLYFFGGVLVLGLGMFLIVNGTARLFGATEPLIGLGKKDDQEAPLWRFGLMWLLVIVGLIVLRPPEQSAQGWMGVGFALALGALVLAFGYCLRHFGKFLTGRWLFEDKTVELVPETKS